MSSLDLYETTSLDFASFLIEMEASYVRSTWDGRHMSWTFRAEPKIEDLRASWVNREAVRLDPRSFLETRQTLLAEIKNKSSQKRAS